MSSSNNQPFTADFSVQSMINIPVVSKTLLITDIDAFSSIYDMMVTALHNFSRVEHENRPLRWRIWNIDTHDDAKRLMNRSTLVAWGKELRSCKQYNGNAENKQRKIDQARSDLKDQLKLLKENFLHPGKYKIASCIHCDTKSRVLSRCRDENLMCSDCFEKERAKEQKARFERYDRGLY